ncbi:carbohydrate ABC transporter permease [Virgibacillus natechei]
MKLQSIRRVISPERSPLIFLLPLFLFLSLMVVYPIGRIIYLSFTQNILTRPDLGISFIGFENYTTLLSSSEFWATVLRTVLWTGFSVVGKCLIAMCIALLFTKDIAFKKVYTGLLLIPWVTPMVVAAVVWKWLFDGDFGTINYILLQLNIIHEPLSWLGNEVSAFIATAIVDMWIGIPFLALMFLSGLQSVPLELNESANIDGATPFQRFFYITLPVMKPIILVATVLTSIWTFNSFGVIWPMTSGGPVQATTTLVVDAYKRSFGAFDMGMGATIAIIIFLLLVGFTMIYKRLLDRQGDL